MRKDFDVIIIGGSYAGLAAAMSLGRALLHVLIVDRGEPCNRYAAHSHNFITHDGAVPAEISAQAREQVLQYPTVRFLRETVTDASRTGHVFTVTTGDHEIYTSKKLLLATGIQDVFPDIPGFAACWGISILHCPYCHGYEVRHQRTAVLANGDIGFEYVKLISHWTKDLVLLTNGKSTLSESQQQLLAGNGIRVIETGVDFMEQENGRIKNVVLKDGTHVPLDALYHRPQHLLPGQFWKTLGCELNEQQLLRVDMLQKTTVSGVFAAGDCTTPGRAISIAVAAGAMAGISISKELIDEAFGLPIPV
jgi:thioredoxin reductase